MHIDHCPKWLEQTNAVKLHYDIQIKVCALQISYCRLNSNLPGKLTLTTFHVTNAIFVVLARPNIESENKNVTG